MTSRVRRARPAHRARVRTPRGWGALLLAAVLVGLTAAPARSAPSPSPSLAPEDPLTVVVTELLPRNPQPGGAFEVHGILRNQGVSAINGISVRLRIGSPVTTRGGLHDGDSERPVTQPRSQTATMPIARSLEPGASTRFAIRTTVQGLGLNRLGVYPVDVEARGDAGDGFDTLGLAPTWVPYFNGMQVKPTRVAVVWPLVDRPHQRALGAFRDDDLATTLAPQGRLGRMLTAGASAATG
ncbi:MAG: glycoprotein, partial [Frankiales bacterium]|nr:glycoprotein [Frankiales bacterium]